GAHQRRSQCRRLGRVRDERDREHAAADRRVMQLPSGLAVCMLAGLVACGTSGAGDDAPETFIAFGNTFATFRSWTSFHSDGPADDGTFTPDVLGPRTQYISKLPPAGSQEFPVGTVIVESRENGSMK